MLPVIRTSWKGVLIMVTNPVDVLCTLVQRHTGLDRRQIIGYTLNDTLRFRTTVAQALRVSPSVVDAWVIGEHGEHCVPLYSRLKSEGVAVQLSTSQQREMDHALHSWYARHVALDAGRTTTWSSGIGISRIILALAHPGQELWPASVVLDGEFGLREVSLSVPVSLGARGAMNVAEWVLTEAEQTALNEAAAHVRHMADEALWADA
jgi:malate/lactate dehydrogenase